MGMNRISTYAEGYDSAKDVGAVPTISTKKDIRLLSRIKSDIVKA